MIRYHKIIDWELYLKCSKCWELKHLNMFNRRWDHLYSSHCKKCISEHKKKYISDNPEKYREYYRQHRDHYLEWHKQNRINNRQKYTDINRERRHNKWYNKYHVKTYRLIKKLWIRPNICPICWNESYVIAHHPDYEKRYEIVFCCNWCHTLIHNWKIKQYNIINLLNI